MGKSADAPEVQETPEEQQLAKIAMERYSDYQNRFVPVENQYMEDVSHIGPGEAHQVQGQTAGAIQDQYGNALDQATTNLNTAGVNPASGRALATTGGLYNSEGRSLGLGTTEAGNQVENLHYRGLENVVNMGLGIKDNAQLGLSNVAGLAAQNATNDAQVEQYTDAARASALGAGLGAFAGYGLPYLNRKPKTGG